ncbi:transposase [bacterium]|nr:transposase [bacterium]
MLRKNVRLKNFDYSSYGAYFITVCSSQRRQLFGAIEDGRLVPTQLGEMLASHIEGIPKHQLGFDLGDMVIMPNHIHLLLTNYYDPSLSAAERAARKVVPVTTVVGLFKSGVTREWRKLIGDALFEVWQRGFYEHVVRSEEELYLCREYIQNNPRAWHLDRENAKRSGENELYKRIGGVLRN